MSSRDTRRPGGVFMQVGLIQGLTGGPLPQ